MDFPVARQRMVDEQITARGVRDPRALEALRDVPRHLFVGDDATRRRTRTGRGQAVKCVNRSFDLSRPSGWRQLPPHRPPFTKFTA